MFDDNPQSLDQPSSAQDGAEPQIKFASRPLGDAADGALAFCLAMEIAADNALKSRVGKKYLAQVNTIAAEARYALNGAMSAEQSLQFAGEFR